MRYAICYVSTAANDLSTREIKTLFEQTTTKNNSLDISGFLICAERNFFQLLDGEKTIIADLFSIISNDPRHHNLIKIVDKPMEYHLFNNKYFSDFISENIQFPSCQIESYFRYMQGLDLTSQNAVKRILEAMII